MEHGVTACSVAAVKLLLLDMCVSYQADTSRIVHQSRLDSNIIIHKSEIKKN